MKRMRILWVIILLNSILMSAKNNEEFFLRGNQLYRQGSWQEALNLYDAIDHRGAAVWYNMGNCWYHLHDYPRALAAWKRAERMADRSLRVQCRTNQALISSQNSEGYLTFLRHFFGDYAASYSIFMLQILVLLLWYAFFLFSRAAIHSKLYRLLRSVTGFPLIICVILLSERYLEKQCVTGIVQAHETNLFAGPDNRYQPLRTLQAAEQVLVHDIRADWCRISTSAESGWVDTRAIEIIG